MSLQRFGLGILTAAGVWIIGSNDSLKTKLEPQLASQSRLIHFRYLADLTDPERLLPQFLQERGFAVQEAVDFPGVGLIDRYQSRP